MSSNSNNNATNDLLWNLTEAEWWGTSHGNGEVDSIYKYGSGNNYGRGYDYGKGNNSGSGIGNGFGNSYGDSYGDSYGYNYNR